MKGSFDFGNLSHWTRQSLGMALDAEFSILDERAKELLAQMAETGDKDRSFMELVAACGRQLRRILAAHMMDSSEIESGEQEFWAKVVQIAGKYVEDRPVKHWLAKIAKCQAIDAQWRMKRVLYRVGDGGEDVGRRRRG